MNIDFLILEKIARGRFATGEQTVFNPQAEVPKPAFSDIFKSLFSRGTSIASEPAIKKVTPAAPPETVSMKDKMPRVPTTIQGSGSTKADLTSRIPDAAMFKKVEPVVNAKPQEYFTQAGQKLDHISNDVAARILEKLGFVL